MECLLAEENRKEWKPTSNLVALGLQFYNVSITTTTFASDDRFDLIEVSSRLVYIGFVPN